MACSCLEKPTLDSCVEYTGPDIEAVGIKNGIMYDELTMKLIDQLLYYIGDNIELKCLYDNTCGNCQPFVSVPEAVQSLVNKICSLTTEDIIHNGTLYCLSDGSTSVEGASLLGRPFNYSISSTLVGSSFNYNITEAVKNLPNGFANGRTRVTVTGKNKRGNTIIKSANDLILSVPVENDRFPINVNFESDIHTPNGTIRLYKNLSIPSPLANSYVTTFDVKDFTSTDTSNLTQKTFNDIISAQVCENKTFMEQLKSFQLPDAEDFNVGGPGLESTIGALAAAIQGLFNEIKTLKLTIETQLSNGCGNQCDDGFETGNEEPVQGCTTGTC